MNEQALYQKWGFNVIPLAKNSKEPLAGLNLQRYFNEKYPSETISNDLNLGVITGKTSGISVIDIDQEDKLQHYITSFPTHRIQKSPHGYHLFYKYNEHLPAIKKIDGGDWFNGNHYVVIAPSKVNNLAYEWLDTGDLGVIPDNAFEQKQVSIQSGKYTRAEIYELINYALSEGKPLEGSGNDTILYGSMVLAGDGWTNAALSALMKNLNKARDNPESESIVQGMVNRAFEYAKTKKVEQKPQEMPQSRSVEFNILSYSTMLEKYMDYKAEWLVNEWLPKSSVIICSALPEMYKTWLSVDLAISVASGMPFLETFDVTQTGNVLIVQQEDFGPEFISRFKTVERGKTARLCSEITLTEDAGVWLFYDPCFIGDKIFFHEDAELSLENSESLDKLEQRIKETQAILCIIDPFYSLSSSKDWFAQAAETIRARIKKIRNETGCTFFFVHHNKKTGSGEGNDRGQMYGSTLLNAAMEGQWGISRTSDMGATEILAYRHFKTKKAGLPTHIKLHIDMNADDSEAYWLEVEESTTDTREILIQYLIDNGPTTFSELFEIYQDKFGSKSTFTKFLKGLVGNGINQDGKRGAYFVEPDAS